jgi:hypothetical protein
VAKADSKRCCTCKANLQLSAFGPSKQGKDGLRRRCKECHRVANAEYRARNPEASKAACRNWQRNNPEKAKAKNDRWKARNPGRDQELKVKWREENRQHLRDWFKEYRRDPARRLMRSVGARIRTALVGKHGNRTEHLVGYTGEELRSHLEKQFAKGMTWENYGQWHIDHIIPLAAFNVTGLDDPELRRAWALANLRPLWAEDNIRKRDFRTHLI